MNILWLCNVPIPQISKKLGQPPVSGGGWLSGFADRLLRLDNVSLTICFPVWRAPSLPRGRDGRLNYFGFPRTHADPAYQDPALTGIFKSVIAETKPDVIHIWGTEFYHSLAMMNACEAAGILRKAIISIQGICMPYSEHYFAGLPCRVVNGYSFRDLIRRDNVRRQKENFARRGELETRAIKKALHIIGRTEFDRAWTRQINPLAKYHFCNETLRPSFYSGDRWTPQGCERRTIFVSQGSYPIKGLHFALKALEIVSHEFPDARLYVAGPDITDGGTLKKRLKMTRYAKYVAEIIAKSGLGGRAEFLGNLSEIEMRGRYISSNVFASPSSIENSPNSVGEAMILGVPVVSSDAGGVNSMMTHEKDGFLYQYDAPYMLAHYISRIFNDDNLALRLSASAMARAAKTHDGDANLARLLEIYREVRG